MSARTRRFMTVFGAFTAGLVLCLGAIILVSGGRGLTSAAPLQSTVGGPFSLIDQDGKAFTDQDLKGRNFLVFFGFTHCPDVCPTTLFEISEILHRIDPNPDSHQSDDHDAEPPAALFITVDPERDTPAALKDYLSSFDPHIRGLTGSPEAIAAVAKAYHVYIKKVPIEGGDYTMDHTAIVYLMDKDGHFVSPVNMRRSPDDLAGDLRKYLF